MDSATVSVPCAEDSSNGQLVPVSTYKLRYQSRGNRMDRSMCGLVSSDSRDSHDAGRRQLVGSHLMALAFDSILS